MILQPFVQLRTRNGCTELVNNARTLAYIGNGWAHSVWQVNRAASCSDVACPTWDAGNYTDPLDMSTNPAPWADPLNVETGEFCGLLVDPAGVRLEGATTSRRRGSSVYDPADYKPRQLTITATLIVASARGLMVGEEWVQRTVGDLCGQTLTLRVARHCATGDEPEFPAWQALARPTHTNSLQVQGIDPCDEVTEDGGGAVLDETGGSMTGGVPLAPLPDGYHPLSIPDPGLRDLLDCRFAYVEDLDDEQMPTCHGKRIIIVFDVLSEGLCWPDDLPTWTPQVLVSESPDACQRRPYDWASGSADPVVECGVCGVPCRCQSRPIGALVEPVALRTCWWPPLAVVRQSVLTPVFAWSQRVAVRVDLNGGQAGSENLRVLVWEAHDGVPDPITARGARAYDNLQPYASWEVAYIPPGSVLSIDGRRQRATLACPGYPEQPGEQLVSGPDGRPLTFPPLTCTRRWWIAVEYDAYNVATDASWQVTYCPVEVG